jgi:hypothetical protein
MMKLDRKKKTTVNYNRNNNLGDILRSGDTPVHLFFMSIILCQDVSTKSGNTAVISPEF